MIVGKKPAVGMPIYTQPPITIWKFNVSKKPKDNPLVKPGNEMLLASHNAGLSEGRLEAIEESMDAVAELIFKAENMIIALGENAAPAIRDNANHTLRALQLAFAAVTESVNGSAAFLDLLAQSRQRLIEKAGAKH